MKMNAGAFGENFPYTNFHDLNMDWIIKIVKKFLDDYSNIETTLTEGIEELEEKATELETLLQQWYDTHSDDIANQLADALEALQQWYTDHEQSLYDYIVEQVGEQLSEQYDSENVIFDNIPTQANNIPHTVSSKGIFDAIHRRRMIVCGDSYLMDYEYNWGMYLKASLNIPDGDFYYGGLSGAGFLSAPGTTEISNGFLTGISAISESVTSPETITDIVLCGGLNDSSYDPTAFPQTEFNNNVEAFLQYCKTHYPIARIWIGYCGNAYDSGSDYIGTRTIDNRLYAIDRYSSIYSNVPVSINTDIWKVFTLDFNMFNTTDWLHPNSLGSMKIAMAIKSWLTGSPTIIKNGNGRISRSIGNDITSGLSQQPYYGKVDNGYLTLNINNWYEQNGYRYDYLGALNTQYTPGSDIHVSTISSGNFLFIKPFKTIVPMCYGNIPTQTYCSAILTFTGNKILIQPLTTTAIPANTNIFIASNQTITIPPEYYV